MANLDVNMPDDLYERLRRVAGKNADDSAVSRFALAVIRQEVERLESGMRLEKHEADAAVEHRKLTMAEWQARRKNRPVLHINFDAAAAIREERQRREQEWDRYMELRQKSTS